MSCEKMLSGLVYGFSFGIAYVLGSLFMTEIVLVNKKNFKLRRRIDTKSKYDRVLKEMLGSYTYRKNYQKVIAELESKFQHSEDFHKVDPKIDAKENNPPVSFKKLFNF